MIELQNKSVLITAGSTMVMIDSVRGITNIFRGRTGEAIARVAAAYGWRVTLLSSMPSIEPDHPLIKRVCYRTYDELAGEMGQKIVGEKFDAIIHSAAVSDFQPIGAYVYNDVGHLVPLHGTGSSKAKIPSSYSSIFIQMVATVKLVDQIRQPWGFTGKLVKFKLQAGMSDDELLAIAKKSLAHSNADFLVANCLEWSKLYAYIVDASGGVEKVSRDQLALRLMERLT